MFLMVVVYQNCGETESLKSKTSNVDLNSINPNDVIKPNDDINPNDINPNDENSNVDNEVSTNFMCVDESVSGGSSIWSHKINYLASSGALISLKTIMKNENQIPNRQEKNLTFSQPLESGCVEKYFASGNIISVNKDFKINLVICVSEYTMPSVQHIAIIDGVRSELSGIHCESAYLTQ